MLTICLLIFETGHTLLPLTIKLNQLSDYTEATTSSPVKLVGGMRYVYSGVTYSEFYGKGSGINDSRYDITTITFNFSGSRFIFLMFTDLSYVFQILKEIYNETL